MKSPDRSKATDHWATPEWIALRLGLVNLDPCWNPTSPIRARHKFGQLDAETFVDAFGGQEWPVDRDLPVYINPPYSAPRRWCAMARAIKEASWPVVMLLKDDGSTLWAAEVLGPGWFKGEFPFRLKYGGAKTGANFPSMLVTNDAGMIARFPECRWSVVAAMPSAPNPQKAAKKELAA